MQWIQTQAVTAKPATSGGSDCGSAGLQLLNEGGSVRPGRRARAAAQEQRAAAAAAAAAGGMGKIAFLEPIPIFATMGVVASKAVT